MGYRHGSYYTNRRRRLWAFVEFQRHRRMTCRMRLFFRVLWLWPLLLFILFLFQKSGFFFRARRIQVGGRGEKASSV